MDRGVCRNERLDRSTPQPLSATKTITNCHNKWLSSHRRTTQNGCPFVFTPNTTTNSQIKRPINIFGQYPYIRHQVYWKNEDGKEILRLLPDLYLSRG